MELEKYFKDAYFTKYHGFMRLESKLVKDDFKFCTLDGLEHIRMREDLFYLHDISNGTEKLMDKNHVERLVKKQVVYEEKYGTWN